MDAVTAATTSLPVVRVKSTSAVTLIDLLRSLRWIEASPSPISKRAICRTGIVDPSGVRIIIFSKLDMEERSFSG